MTLRAGHCINTLTVSIYRILFSKYFYAHFKTRTQFHTISEENYTFSTEWNHFAYTIPIYLIFCIGYIIFLHSVLSLWIQPSENAWKISSQYAQYSPWNPAFFFKWLHLQTLSQQGPWCYQSNFKIL